jgi:HEAT repeat protein
VLALGALALACLALLVLHGVWGWARRRALAAGIAQARAGLVRAAESGSLPVEGRDALLRLPSRAQLELFAAIVPNLAGEPRRVLTHAARDVGLLDSAERLCRSPRWQRRLRGVRLLTLFGAGEIDAKLALMADHRELVRAQAAVWAADETSPVVAGRLVAMLSDASQLVRFTAMDVLVRIGRPAIASLAEAIGGASGATVHAALDVGAHIGDAALLDVALTRADDHDPLVRAGVARLVGGLGGPAATRALERLLADRDERVRAMAASGIGRLGYWPAGPALVGRLADASWEVRRRSALALRALDAPGRLLLTRASRDTRPAARHIACLTLALPGTAHAR